MAEQGSSWGMQLAVLGAWGVGIGLAYYLLINTGVKRIADNYGGPNGTIVAAGQFCAKYPNARNCPQLVTQYVNYIPTHPLQKQIAARFKAGYSYPNEANPYARPGYEFLVRDGTFH